MKNFCFCLNSYLYTAVSDQKMLIHKVSRSIQISLPNFLSVSKKYFPLPDSWGWPCPPPGDAPPDFPPGAGVDPPYLSHGVGVALPDLLPWAEMCTQSTWWRPLPRVSVTGHVQHILSCVVIFVMMFRMFTLFAPDWWLPTTTRPALPGPLSLNTR